MKKKIKVDAIRRGDIFAFQLRPGVYSFGVIISKIMDGHVVEIFDYFSKEFSVDITKLDKTFYPPLILDSYSLFQKSSEGEWGIVGHQDGYSPDEKVLLTKFAWGVRGDQSVTTVNNQHISVSDDEAAKWPRCQPWGDYDVKEYVALKIGKSDIALS